MHETAEALQAKTTEARYQINNYVTLVIIDLSWLRDGVKDLIDLTVDRVAPELIKGLTRSYNWAAKSWTAWRRSRDGVGGPPSPSREQLLEDLELFREDFGTPDDVVEPEDTRVDDTPIRQLTEDEARAMILRGETPDPRACESVFRINLNGTKIDDLAPLKTLANLEKLYLSDTKVTDLAPLKTLANLQELDLHNTEVADLTPVRHVPDIRGATAEAYATIGRDAEGRPIER
ncbi:MAG: leucine-rich repeat domain-containing protein [Maricaulaceae bacterium]